jgi:hypothetical protein
MSMNYIEKVKDPASRAAVIAAQALAWEKIPMAVKRKLRFQVNVVPSPGHPSQKVWCASYEEDANGITVKGALMPAHERLGPTVTEFCYAAHQDFRFGGVMGTCVWTVQVLDAKARREMVHPTVDVPDAPEGRKIQ